MFTRKSLSVVVIVGLSLLAACNPTSTPMQTQATIPVSPQPAMATVIPTSVAVTVTARWRWIPDPFKGKWCTSVPDYDHIHYFNGEPRIETQNGTVVFNFPAYFTSILPAPGFGGRLTGESVDMPHFFQVNTKPAAQAWDRSGCGFTLQEGEYHLTIIPAVATEALEPTSTKMSTLAPTVAPTQSPTPASTVTPASSPTPTPINTPMPSPCHKISSVQNRPSIFTDAKENTCEIVLDGVLRAAFKNHPFFLVLPERGKQFVSAYFIGGRIVGVENDGTTMSFDEWSNCK
jgi:hypothetical protein